MGLPLALVNASGESRDRSGPITATPSDANVDVTGDAWRLWKGISGASLLLSPDGSYDADGPVAPDIGENVITVAGKYGNAWQTTSSARSSLLLDASDYISPDMTVLARHLHTDLGGGYFLWSINRDGVRATIVGEDPVVRAGRWMINDVATHFDKLPDELTDSTVESAARISPTASDAKIENQYVSHDAGLLFDASGPQIIEALGLGWAKVGITLESLVIFNAWLDDSERDHLMAMPRRWEWGPPGTLTIPMPTAPASVIVRHLDAGVSVTEAVVLVDGSATFADGTGTLDWQDGELTVGTTKSADVEGVIAYPDVVSEGVLQRVAGMETWTWSGLQDRVGGIIRISLPEPLAIGRAAGTSPISIARVGGSQHG